MTSYERWLSSATLVLAVLPLVMIAAMLRLFPVEFVLFFDPSQSAAGSVAMEKGRLFYLALFCIVPVSLTILARFLKNKGREIFGFTGMIVGSLILSVGYLSVILYILISTLLLGGMINPMEVVPFLCSGGLLFSCVLVNALPLLPRAPVPWVRVRNQSAFWMVISPKIVTVLTYALLFSGIAVAFFLNTLALSLTAAILFACYVYTAAFTLILAGQRRKKSI